jgi:hypothetical protein
MSMREEFRSPVDDEIDVVARSLMTLPPPAALRSAVSAQITGRSGGNPAVRWSLGIAVAAAVIALAFGWPDREAPVDTGASRSAVATVAPSPASDLSIEPEPTQPAPVVTRALPESEPPIEVEILELAPLELEPLGLPLLALEAWDVEPLTRQQ